MAVDEARIPVTSAAPAAFVRVGATSTLTFGGRFRVGFDRWVHLPVDVPPGIRRITVQVDHDRFPRLGPVARNVLDLGIFAPAGTGSAGAGFRGWSGGARDWFTIAVTDATPGYLPGPIDPGRWIVVLGPVVLNPVGMSWSVRVELEHGDPAGSPALAVPPPGTVPGRGPGWYRGDLHLHSVHSDGQRDLDCLAAAARGAGLDFIASTEHNTSAANGVWGAHRLDGLLVIPGEEVTTRHGHWLAIGLPPHGWIDWRYRPGSGAFARFAAAVRAGGGLVVAAHPAVPVPGSAWTFGYRHVDAIEVWNGVWNADDEVSLRIWHALLRRGRRVVAVGGSDSHAEHQPVGYPQTVVRATGLSTPAIVAALRQGRAYLAASADVTLALAASVGEPPVDADVSGTTGRGRAGPGESLAVPVGGPVVVTAHVSGAPNTRLAVISRSGVVARVAVGRSGVGTARWTTTGTHARFVRLEVRGPSPGRLLSRMVALTNPVWLVPG